MEGGSVNRSLVIPRGRVQYILTAAAAALLAALCVALLVHIAPAGAARDTAAAEKVLTLRFDGTQDALWLVSEEGTATAAGKLPGVAADVAVSPDGSTAAYLPFAGKPFVWIGYGPDGAKTIDLAPAGVKTLTGMTWTSNDQLLISGSKKAKTRPASTTASTPSTSRPAPSPRSAV